MLLTAIQLAQRISKLSMIKIVRNGKIRCRFVRRYGHGLWEPYEKDGYAVIYGIPVDDREVVHYVSGGDYVIFAR